MLAICFELLYYYQARLREQRSFVRCGEMAEFGLRRTTGNRVYGEPYQGFESLSLRHKSTVILIELRWDFSMPENGLKSGFSAISAHK